MYWYGPANKACCCCCWKLSSSFSSLPDLLPMGVLNGLNGFNRQPSKGRKSNRQRGLVKNVARLLDT